MMCSVFAHGIYFLRVAILPDEIDWVRSDTGKVEPIETKLPGIS